MTVILIICTLAVGHILFMAAVLFYLNHRLSNRLLAILLILIAIRVGKSVIQMQLKPDMSYGTSVAGVIAMACIGPILYLFIRSLFSSSFRIDRLQWLHFLPALLLPVFVFSGWNLLAPVYYGITAHVIIYTAWCWIYLFQNRTLYKVDDLRWGWATLLLVSMSVLAASFVLQVTIYEPTTYLVNVIVAASFAYFLSFWAIRRSRIFISDPPGPPEKISALNELGERIQALFEKDLAYTDTTLTVSKIGAQLKVPAYLVSRAVNLHFEKSFSEVIIEYRLKKAEQLLQAEESNRYTIEAIAFESGFNTLSAFYAAFKRTYRTTPAQFRTQKTQKEGKAK